MAKAPVKKQKKPVKAANKPASKPAAKPAGKIVNKVVSKKAAPKLAKKVTPKKAPVAKKAVPKKVTPKVVAKKAAPVVVKPVKVAKPVVVKPVKQPVVKVAKEDKKKVAKELKLKGKKGKAADSFEEELELGSAKTADEDEDDDLFSEKKNTKVKPVAGERLKKEADLPTEKMFNLEDYFQWKDVQQSLENLDFFLPKDDACMQRLCENIRTTGPYCRLHYIANWKLMQQKKEILKEGKLQTLIEDFVTKYPASFIQAVMDDLDSDREFHKVLTELNISDTEFDIEEVAVAVEDEDDDTIDFESRSMDTFKPGGFDEE